MVPHLTSLNQRNKKSNLKEIKGKRKFCKDAKGRMKKPLLFLFKKENHAQGWVKMHVSMHTIFTLEFQFSLYDSLAPDRHILFKSYDNIIFSASIARWHL